MIYTKLHLALAIHGTELSMKQSSIPNKCNTHVLVSIDLSLARWIFPTCKLSLVEHEMTHQFVGVSVETE